MARKERVRRRIWSILLALAMVVSMSAPAFAEQGAPVEPGAADAAPQDLQEEEEIIKQIIADTIAAGGEQQPDAEAEPEQEQPEPQEAVAGAAQPALLAAGDPWYEPDDCVKIIFDTDIDSDVDDAGAMALLHAYAQQGRAELLAMACCAYGPYCAPCVDAINTYYGLPDIPVGTDRSDEFKSPSSKYNQFVAQTYANDIHNGYYAPDAVEVYRETLAGQPDNSVVLVVVGTLNNLEALLQSGPDEYSDLTGMELVQQKVKLVSCMAGIFPSGKEHNIQFACRSAQYVAENCPVPIMFSGWEIGSKIKTGGLRGQMEEDNPVRRSYDLYCGANGTRESWDLTSVVYAVEGLGDYWDMETGRIIVNDDGSNSWEANEAGTHARLIEKMDPGEVTRAIDELMIAAKKQNSDEPYVEVVDNADPRVEIAGGFKASGAQNPQRYNKTAYFGNTVGATITFPFTGIGIEAFGGMQFEHGKAEVYIDGELDQVIDTYQKDEVVSTLIYKSGLLEDGDHTFTLKIIEELSDGGSDHYTDLDYFRVIRASEPPPKPKPEPALVAHWTFDGKTEDGKIADATGNGHDGALTGAPALVAGKVNNAIRFDTDGQLMTVVDADDLDFAEDDSFTLSTWVKVEALTSDWQMIVQKGRTSNDTWYCLGLSNPAKAFNFGAHGGNNVSDGKHVALGEWVLMTAVQDGDAGARTLYLNGKAVASGPASGSVTDRTMTFGGVDSARPENFKGQLDDFRIYNYALSQEEIDALYEGKPQPEDPDLLARWTFDGAQDGKVVDVTGNGHDGVIDGSPQFVAGKVDNAIRFSADGQRVVVSETSDLDFATTDSFTISSWIKAERLGSGWQVVMQKGRPTDSVWYGIWVSSGNKYSFGGNGGNVDGKVPKLDRWYHVAVVQDGAAGTRRIYMDGELIGSGAVRNGVSVGQPFTFGGVDSEYTEYFRGQVDDVSIYKRVLSGEELAAIYEAGEAQNPEPPEPPEPERVKWTGEWPQPESEVANIIFDTDIGPDVDDAGAMALLNAYANQGRANLLAMMCDTSCAYGAPCLDAINTYYGRPDVPIGTLKSRTDIHPLGMQYNKYVAQNYENDLYNGYHAPDAVDLYREILAGQPDNSVTIVAVGMQTNLYDLLRSGPDAHSDLSGRDLVAKKVKLVSCMGCRFPQGSEWNIEQDPIAAKYVAENWPTPIVYTGGEIGDRIQTGGRRAEMALDDPVRKSYDLYVGVGNTRQSWDLTAVVYAVEGLSDYWTMKRGDVSIEYDAYNAFQENNETGARGYLVEKMSPSGVAAAIDALFVSPQKNNPDEPRVEIIDDHDPKVVAVGFNRIESGRELWNETLTYGNTPGATITIPFRGTGIKLFGGLDLVHGKAEITIDGEAAGVIDTYAPVAVKSTCIFDKQGLADGEHTLVLKVLDEKQEASGGVYTDLDYCRVTLGEEVPVEWPDFGETANIILDTDACGNVDDYGAMGVLHALADREEANILAMMCSSSCEHGAPAIDAVNTYYGRPDIPIGTLKEKGFLESEGDMRFNKYLSQNYPNDTYNGYHAPDATALYRKILAEQPDNSVTIVVVGPQKNLSNLLSSGPDEWSDLSGHDLVAKKVKLVSIMGGAYLSGSEHNFTTNAAAAEKVAASWPTPIAYSGFDIGANIRIGEGTVSMAEDDPVRWVYAGGNHQSWDVTALLYGVRGGADYWDIQRGKNNVSSNGGNVWSNNDNGSHAYLVPKMSNDGIAKELNGLLASLKKRDPSNLNIDLIDSADNAVEHSGFNVSTNGHPEYLGKTSLYSNQIGATIRYTFQGTGIEIYGGLDLTHGRCEISIDGALVETIDTYAPVPVISTRIFAADGLEDREHTVEMKIIAEKNEASSDYYTDLDYFRVVTEEVSDQADKSMLRALIAAIDGKYGPDRFTAESYAALTVALDAAKAVVDDPAATQQQVYDAYLALVKARDGLVYATDDSLLRLAIQLAEDALAADNLTGGTRAALENAVIRARALLAGDPTQEEINAMYREVMLAITQLAEQANRDQLKRLIDAVKDFSEQDYKPSGWAGFSEALASAVAVCGDTDATTEQIQAAYAALTQAVTALARRANFAALQSAYDFAFDLSGRPGYDTSSLAELMAQAKAMLDAQEADQGEADALAAELATATARVRLAKGINAARALREADYTEASWNRLMKALDAAQAVFDDNAADEAALAGQESALQAALKSLDPIRNPSHAKGSASKASDSDYWDGVKDRIADTEKGGAVGITLTADGRMPATVLDLAKGKGVNLSIAANGGETLLKADAMRSNPAAVYYSAAELTAMAGGETTATGASAHTNPETGGEPAAASPQALEPGALAKPAAPIVIGPDAAQPAAPAPAEADGDPAVAVVATFALLAAAAAAIILLRRSQCGR